MEKSLILITAFTKYSKTKKKKKFLVLKTWWYSFKLDWYQVTRQSLSK